MKLKNVPLLLLLPLLISACDSQQPTYSASNANTAPPPAPAQEAPPPPPAAAAPMPVADTRPPAEPERKPYGVDAPRHVASYSGSPAERSEALAPVKPIGIGSCDSYIERYRACVNTGVANRTMPNASKFALTHAFNRQVRKWQADVAAGNTSDLVSACAEAEKQARDELVKAGCTSF